MNFPYSVLEKDGVTLVEVATDEETALLATPKDGRAIFLNGVMLHIAIDSAWVRTNAPRFE